MHRRQFLATTALAAGLAGCLDDQAATGPSATPTTTARSSPTPTDEPDPTDEPTETGEPGEWSPAWERSVPEENVLDLLALDGELYGLLSDRRTSALVRLAPDDGATEWRAEFDGEAESGSYAGYRPIARDQWGVTPADGTLYSVHGFGDDYEWTAVHAVDRASGERRWSVERDRELSVHGVAAGTVFVTGREFFVPDHTHDTPDEPLESVLYALDAATGAVRWSQSFAGVVDVAVAGDAAYVAASGGLVALGVDGSRRFEVRADRPARAVRATDRRVYFCTEAGSRGTTVRGVDPSGGVAWTEAVPAREVALRGDRLYAGGESVVALDPDGSVAWRDATPGGWFLFGPVGDSLYTRVGGYGVGAYALPSGAHRWTYDPPEKYGWPVGATTDVAVAEGYADGRTLYAVDRATGEVRERRTLGDLTTVFTVATLSGRVFVGTDAVTAYDA